MKIENCKLKIKDRSGFTLIEILFATAILTLLVSAVSAFLLWTLRAQAKTKALGETRASVERALETIAREVRRARSIYLPTSTTSQISLELVPAPGEATAYLDVYRCGTRLCIKREGEPPSRFTPGSVEVADIALRPIGTSTPAVQIALTLQYGNPAGRPEYRARVNATTTAAVREY